MTLKEIIKEAAADHWSTVCCGFDDPIADDKEESFIVGAEWEHKRLVEKACEWLKENVSKYFYVIKVEGTEYRKVHFTDSLIEDFRKAMEE